MDFYDISVVKDPRKATNYKIAPIFTYMSERDLVCKGGELYAFWYNNRWHQELRDLVTIIDKDIYAVREEILKRNAGATADLRLMSNHSSNVMKEFASFTKLFPQSDAQFNTRIIFNNEIPKREDYSTNQLPYTPAEGPTPAFDEMFNKLYRPEELDKILWFIGALLSNKMPNIQKFMYLYGSKGTGKGTVISLIEELFQGYFAHISLARLTGGSEFATSQIKEVPLLLDTDSKINKIKDDTNLLKLTAHETISVNIKHKQLYDVTFKGLLVTASNQRYQVNNIDSGITRRAVVVHPSNLKHDSATYFRLRDQIKFELPGIAQKAIDRFNELGEWYYEDYMDVGMAESTDHIFAFVRENYKYLGDPCSLKKASELYKIYLEDIGYDIGGYKKKIKEELMRYYDTFSERYRDGAEVLSNMYSGFKYNTVFPERRKTEEIIEENDLVESYLNELGLVEQKSVFDSVASSYLAQLTNNRGNPMYKWDNVNTRLKDIDTKKLHFVQVPINHIVIDFDITEDGEKSLLRNLEKARTFPKTYTELSKSGQGVHLHYIYEGDPTVLEKIYEDDIEIKVFTGKSALRRRLSKCNNTPIATLSSGLPVKEKKGVKMYEDVSVIVLNEKKLRKIVENNLKKIYHPNTKPSIDFIVKVFKEAEQQNVKYDLRDMKNDILVFAGKSTNQADACLKAIGGIKYSTIDDDDQFVFQKGNGIVPKEEIYFFDIEVFVNLFVVVYKKYGNNPKIKLINPSSQEIEELLKHPLVGFNNRRYDNHIVYGALLDSDPLHLYRQSKRIIDKVDGAFYSGAYELSYADIYEYSSKKQSLKKWEIELGIHHDELEIPWDKPVPEDLWDRVAEYCGNDVDATEATFEATYADYEARLIISELSGLSVNSKTQDHAREFIFDGAKKTQDHLVYTDLSKEFKGYKYEYGKSTYKGLEVNEGGRVVAKPGIYQNVGLFDIASMHPNSAINLNYFGKYTPRFKDLVESRIHIKHKNFEEAGKMFDGKLKPYLNEQRADALSYALKIIINIVYGMSSAPYENAFRHKDNVDNIVAKRGSLFMVDLQEAVEAKGYNIFHVKTDSIKVENVDREIADFIFEFGKKYGYTFEWEATYDKVALVDKANYIAINKRHELDTEVLKDYDVTGAVFADPVVFKKLFSKEDLIDLDFAQTKEVKNASIYLGDKFIGRIAEVYASVSGDEAYRVGEDKEGKETKGALSGTKGHLWRLYSDFKGKEDIDMYYYIKEADKAYKKIEEVGNPELITDYKPMN